MIKLNSTVSLYSNKKGEIETFLNKFYNKTIKLSNSLEWLHTFDNPIEISDIIGVFIENNDKYKINMWISLDKGIFINITDYNADKIIRYLFERYPY